MESIVNVRRILAAYVEDPFLEIPADERGQAGDYPTVQVSGGEDFESVVRRDVEEPGAAEAAPPRFEFAAEADVDTERLLGSGVGEHVRRAAIAKGVDGLAWYVSFHARGPQWGIFIPISSVVGLAVDVFGKTKMPLPAAMKLAAHVMHQHELFHFAVDYMTAMWEVATLRPCWKPGRSLRKPRGYYELEEKLANAHMLRRINAVSVSMKVAGRAAALREFVAMQPPGYRDAPEAVRPDVFRSEGIRLCLEYFRESDGGHHQEPAALLAGELLNPGRLEWKRCPVHIVHDESRFSLPEFTASLFSSISEVFETERFQKQLLACHPQVQKAWRKQKQLVASTLSARGLDFKLWKRAEHGQEYSIRVNDGFRAHLLYTAPPERWTAVAIGSHKEMGHG